MQKQAMKKHLISSLEQNIRSDGRKLDEYRAVKVQYGVSKTAEGSSMVTIGNTKVIAGVKLSIGTPYPDTPDEGSLIIGAEFLPLSSNEFELGPPGEYSIELARIIDRGIREAKAIDVKKLCIVKGEKIWMVSVDICTINDDGNLLDAAGLATLAALQDTRFPTYTDGGVDYKKKTDKKLPLDKLPIPITVTKIGNHFLIDPKREEEEVREARLTVTTTKDGNLCALQKGEDAPLSVEDVEKMIDIGIAKGKELRKYL